MNAYLTYSAIIGAGLYGIEHGSSSSPNSWATATRRPAFRACHELCTRPSASGALEAARVILGEDVVAHHLNAARVEQETYDSMVHPWDRERYLERG